MRIALLAAAASLLAPPPHPAAAQAQATTGVIRGVVRDPAGAPIAGAVVEFTHRETALRTTVRTTPSGTFVRPLLPIGTYDVTARADDQIGAATARGLVLRVGEEVALTLRFGAVELEGITVEGEREHLVHPEDVTSSTRLSEEVVDGLPNNGRNYLDFALLTPGVAISQGPDGDELNISGQRGIFNNFIVDGADFNNPFFGEQRGGQRPAFTFSQDAIEEVVVVNQGAAAEFGRSAGGFVNVITKSGTNELSGSAHYFGQWDGVSAAYPVAAQAGEPDFLRSQFGFTLGGPIARDRAFFFVAYDQQRATETKQRHRLVGSPKNLAKLRSFLTTQWPGLFEDEFGPIDRTDDARALLVKTDVHLDGSNQLSFKYNYNWSEQLNGTFDVDSWGLSANGIETDEAHAFNFELAVAAQQHAVARAAPAVGARGPGPLVRRSAHAGRRRPCPRRRSSRPWAAGPFPTSAWTSPTASASACRSSCPSIRRTTRDCRSWTTGRGFAAATSSRRASSTTGRASPSSSSASPTAATSSTRWTASSTS